MLTTVFISLATAFGWYYQSEILHEALSPPAEPIDAEPATLGPLNDGDTARDSELEKLFEVLPAPAELGPVDADIATSSQRLNVPGPDSNVVIQGPAFLSVTGETS